MSDMIVIITSSLLLLGASFALIAAIGIVRMPDIYCRMHAATKAGAFGVALILLALCVAVPILRVIIQSVMIIAFFYLTAPVAAHLIGRVSMNQKLPFWKSKN